MQAQFWHNAWDNGKTGWKQRSVNAHLQQHWPALDLPAGCRVLVPLCGDTIDMLWLLEQGHEVIGSELSEAAVKQFFKKNFTDRGESVDTRFDAGHTVYQSGSLSIYCGDFFSLQPTQVGQIDAAYDRAATVAMPAELRLAYADKIRQLVTPAGSVMLIAFEYDQEKMDGPPFSVSKEEVDRLYAEGFDITQMFSHSGPEYRGNLADRGLDTLTETVYRMVRQ